MPGCLNGQCLVLANVQTVLSPDSRQKPMLSRPSASGTCFKNSRSFMKRLKQSALFHCGLPFQKVGYSGKHTPTKPLPQIFLSMKLPHPLKTVFTINLLPNLSQFSYCTEDYWVTLIFKLKIGYSSLLVQKPCLSESDVFSIFCMVYQSHRWLPQAYLFILT